MKSINDSRFDFDKRMLSDGQMRPLGPPAAPSVISAAPVIARGTMNVQCLHTAAMDRCLSSSAPGPSSNEDSSSCVPSPLATESSVLGKRPAPRLGMTDTPRSTQMYSSSDGAGTSTHDTGSSDAGESLQTSGGKRRKSGSSSTKQDVGDCRRLWHPEWGVNYLVAYDTKTDTCTCLKCNKKIDTIKKYSLQRHRDNTHPDTKDWGSAKKKLFVEQANHKLKQMQQSLVKTFVPSKLPQLATYKLGFTLVKHQKPLRFGEAVVEWAASSDPESKIFKTMPKSRQTLTHRVSEMAEFLQMENKNYIRASPCWGIQMDESTDKADHAQAILYVRFANMESCQILTKFLTILRVEGSPNAQNLYGTLNTFVEAESLPKQKLVSFSSDGASVMRPEGRGVSGHLRRNYNSSIFTQHCIVHRQALAAKDGLDKLPSKVHKIVDDVMKHFKNSHVRKEKLKEIIELSEEEHEYNQLVAYHKVRWLSLNDCVQRFTDLIPEIVLYFEQEAQNTAVRTSERAKLFSCICTFSKVTFHC